MAMAASDIERLIRARIPDAEVTIRDLAGDGDHYAATVIAESFRGKSRVQQHQIVYEALKARNGRQAACAGVADRHAGAVSGRCRDPFSCAAEIGNFLLRQDRKASCKAPGVDEILFIRARPGRMGFAGRFAVHILQGNGARFGAGDGDGRRANEDDRRNVHRAIHRQ